MKLPFLDRHEESARCLRLGHHIGEIWEEFARVSVPHLGIGGKTWGPAGRFWGPGTDRKPLEVDVVAESLDGRSLLVGEVKWSAPRDAARLLAELEGKAKKLPFVAGREVVTALWLKAPVEGVAGKQVVSPRQVLDVLR